LLAGRQAQALFESGDSYPFCITSTSVFGTRSSYLVENADPTTNSTRIFFGPLLVSSSGVCRHRCRLLAAKASGTAERQGRSRYRRGSRSRAGQALLARDAEIEDLQTHLEDTRAEVVRAMAKLQSVASRAQAASAMAEAEVALQTMKAGDSNDPPEAAQVTRLVRQSATEFDKANYGGALYLANQAKTVASGYRGRLGVSKEGARPGETLFAVPIKLKTTSRGNVREGPGTNFPVSFTAEAGTAITGFSFADEWVRIADDTGRTGWIHQTLIARP
jgi:Bacterial SH3 domain